MNTVLLHFSITFLLLLLLFVLFSIAIIIIASIIVKFTRTHKSIPTIQIRENAPYYIILWDSILETMVESMIIFRIISIGIVLKFYKARKMYILLFLLSCFSLVLLYKQQELMSSLNDVYNDVVRPSLGTFVLTLLNLTRVIYDILIPFYNFLVSLTKFFYNFLIVNLNIKEILQEFVSAVLELSYFIYTLLESFLNYLSSPFENSFDLETPLQHLFSIPQIFNNTLNEFCEILALPYEIVAKTIKQPYLPSLLNNTVNSFIYLSVRMIPLSIKRKERIDITPFFDSLLKINKDAAQFFDYLIMDTIQDLINVFDMPMSNNKNISVLRNNIVWKKLSFPCFFCIVGNSTNIIVQFVNTTSKAMLYIDVVIEGIIYENEENTKMENKILESRLLLDYNSTFEQINITLNTAKVFFTHLFNNTAISGFSIVIIDVLRIPTQISKLTYLLIMQFLYDIIDNPFDNLRAILGYHKNVDHLWEILFELNKNFYLAISKLLGKHRGNFKLIIINLTKICNKIFNSLILFARLCIDVLANFDKVVVQITTKSSRDYLLSPTSSFVIYINSFFDSVNEIGDSIAVFFYYTNALNCEKHFDYICNDFTVLLECSVGKFVNDSIHLVVTTTHELEHTILAVYSLNVCGVIPQWTSVIRPKVVTTIRSFFDIIANLFNLFPTINCSSACISTRISRMISSYTEFFFVLPMDITYDVIKILMSVTFGTCENYQQYSVADLIINTILTILNSIKNFLENLLSILKCFFTGDTSLENFISILESSTSIGIRELGSILVNIVNIIFALISGNASVVYSNFVSLVENIGKDLFKFIGWFLGDYFYEIVREWINNPVCELCSSLYLIIDPIAWVVKFFTHVNIKNTLSCCFVCKCPTPGSCDYGQAGCRISKSKNMFSPQENMFFMQEDVMSYKIIYNTNSIYTKNNVDNTNDIVVNTHSNTNQYLNSKYENNAVFGDKTNFYDQLFLLNKNVEQVETNCLDFYLYLFGSDNSTHKSINATHLDKCHHIIKLLNSMNDYQYICKFVNNDTWSIYKFYNENKECIKKRIYYFSLGSKSPIYPIITYLKYLQSLTTLQVDHMLRSLLLLQMQYRDKSEETTNQLCNENMKISFNNFIVRKNITLTTNEHYFHKFNTSENALEYTIMLTTVINTIHHNKSVSTSYWFNNNSNQFTSEYMNLCYGINVSNQVLSNIYKLHYYYVILLSKNWYHVFWNSLANFGKKLQLEFQNYDKNSSDIAFTNIYKSSTNILFIFFDIYQEFVKNNITVKLYNNLSRQFLKKHLIIEKTSRQPNYPTKYYENINDNFIVLSLDINTTHHDLASKFKKKFEIESGDTSFLKKCTILNSFIRFVVFEFALLREYYKTCIPLVMQNFKNGFIIDDKKNPSQFRCIMKQEYFIDANNNNVNFCKNITHGCYSDHNNNVIGSKNNVTASVVDSLFNHILNPFAVLFKKDYYSKYSDTGNGDKTFFNLYISSLLKCDLKNALYCQTHSLGFIWGTVATLIFYSLLFFIDKFIVNIPILLYFTLFSFIPVFNYFSYSISPFCFPQISTCILDDLYFFVSNYIFPFQINWGCISKNNSIQSCDSASFLIYPIQVIIYFLYWINPSTIVYLQNTRIPVLYEVMRISQVRQIVISLTTNTTYFTCIVKYCTIIHSCVYIILITLFLISLPFLIVIIRYSLQFILLIFNILYCFYEIDKRILIDLVTYLKNLKEKID